MTFFSPADIGRLRSLKFAVVTLIVPKSLC